ncbi:hypothetical protein VPH35_101277 [Triticum aestivum]|uniref:Uncharacterized protein n=1 Tax=Aegilops tauschii TaxID=37682 RepID=M8BS86_AEGTA
MAGKTPKLQSKDEKHSIHTHKDDDPSVSRMVGLEVQLPNSSTPASCSALPDDVYYDAINPWAKSEAQDIAPCPFLPDDIIEDIFTRLPASLALQCRGLSRDWAATISSDAFVDRHLRAANRHGGPRFFLLSWTPSLTTAHAWSPGGRIAPPPPLTRRLLMRDGVTQQCRGLVVLKERARQPVHCVCVYNSSTGHMTALPRRRLNLMEGLHHRHPAKGHYESFGLGYDARIEKHKVVRIHYRGYQLPDLCEVYVVDDDSGAGFWRAPAAIGRPDATKPAGWVSSYEPSVFAQGHVHWMAQKQSPRKDSHWRVTGRGLIISFSVADEHFGVVPLPPCVDYLGEYQLTELEGRLCLFSPIVDNIKRGHRPYDLWSLRDHETGTWDFRCRRRRSLRSYAVAPVRSPPWTTAAASCL